MHGIEECKVLTHKKTRHLTIPGFIIPSIPTKAY